MILHIATSNTFTRPFFAFVKKHFGLGEHVVLSRSRSNDWPDDLHLKSYKGMWLEWAILFFYLSWKAEKIILHSLNDPRIALILFFQPWNLKKCYWLIWGGDLYSYTLAERNLKWKLKEFFRRPVIRHIGHLVSYVEGDTELARNWYGAKGKYHECLMYTSNLYRHCPTTSKPHSTINIQIGNSADPANFHIEILERLKKFEGDNIRIFAPLSYGGNAEYISAVINTGIKLFGGKFEPITTFMPLGEYIDFLSQIDIAVFNHKRQQAMGNMINLLGLGKKVYIRRDVTLWKLFEKIHVQVYDLSCFSLAPIGTDIKQSNQFAIRKNCSEQEMANQYKAIFLL